jgi:TrmH family RNA methyltransferase
MELRSASNRQKTLLRKLNRKKYRYKERLFLIEGVRAVQQILENRAVKVEALFFDDEQEYWLQPEWRKATQNNESFILSQNIFAEVTDTDNPQGVLAMCRMPGEVPTDELTSQCGLIVALDAVQDPGNLGTIIRTASWFGVSGLLSGRGTVDLFHPKVVRSTAGATGVIPFRNGDLVKLLPEFEASGWEVFLLDAGHNSIALSEVSSLDKAIVVVGNEAHGVDSKLLTTRRKKVRISSHGKTAQVESLNAGVAASIALYDLSAKLK